ncbi:MAG: hypothetical protein WB495_25830 [Xanthobacteraceae bacterium]
MFATLDLMTQGRAAWNVVTSLNEGAEYGARRGARPRSALRRRRRIHGDRARPLGRLGRRLHRSRPQAYLPGLTRCIASTMRAAICARADRLPCRARPGASSSHPGRIERPRQELRRALGGDHLCRGGALRLRSRRRQDHASRQHSGGGGQERG